jgi:hypothetical protein
MNSRSTAWNLSASSEPPAQAIGVGGPLGVGDEIVAVDGDDHSGATQIDCRTR